MGKRDWYRKTTWTESDQVDFWTRFKRARSVQAKPQYLRIQALYLGDSYPSAALELLEKLHEDYPASSQIALMELQRGNVYLQQGEIDLALKAFKASLQHQSDYPNIRTQAWAVYGLTVLKHQRTRLYAAAERHVLAQGENLVFPDQRYKAQAILALIKHHRGETAAAAKHAQAALLEIGATHSGFNRHPDIGLVNDPDLDFVDKLKILSQG